MYQNSFLYGIYGTDNDKGPFRYSKSLQGYQTSYMSLDVIILVFRIFLSGTSAILFCPDYFQNFVQRLEGQPVSIFLEDTDWEYWREFIDLLIQYVLIFTMLSQVFIGYFEYNSPIFGVHLGEFVGQIIYVVTRQLDWIDH